MTEKEMYRLNKKKRGGRKKRIPKDYWRKVPDPRHVGREKRAREMNATGRNFQRETWRKKKGKRWMASTRLHATLE